MSRALPPLDLHAHVDVGIASRDLESLGAVVFAATRSLEEAERALARTDLVTVWGAGCHPGVAKAQANFDASRFSSFLADTPFVSEVGLDGASKVALHQQRETFAAILAEATHAPRLVSVHSKRATSQVLDMLEAAGTRGAILHWWLGSTPETKRALELGCLFSVNASMDVADLREAGVPLEAILPETDHPSGNRTSSVPRQPGRIADVERSLAAVFGATPEVVRAQTWRTLARACGELDLDDLFPIPVQRMLAAARELPSSAGGTP
ncbi:TatD family hydrolase [Actinotalea ferrariae]|uniref:TatD family hydrolase n=1 Tax=Actinotalea ferrariae TaxID=1386098 RepID=UPI0005571800|nr:TatD family hydrolase [Actinotalea ferrariae]